MLSKINRFHGLGSLNYVYKKGQIVRSPYCSMKFCRGRQDHFRIAVVVSKKVDKSAPARNRIRRRVYEAVRLNAKTLTNQDIIITVFDDRFMQMPFRKVELSIRRQLKQIARSS